MGDPDSAYVTHEPLILAQARAYKRGFLLGAALLAGLCVVAAGIGHVAGLDGVERIDALAGMGVVMSVLLAIPGLGDPRNHRVLVALRTRAANVVWAYVAKGRGPEALVLGMDDGKRLFLSCNQGVASAVLSAVAAIATAATLGFTPENERRFLAQPSSLRRS